MSPSDDGHAISYKVLEPGTPVQASDGSAVGTVREVLENVAEHIFDGLTIDTPAGERFVDAPEVARTFERAVTLSITAAQLPELAKPVESKLPLPEAKPGGFLSKLFNR